MKRVTDLEGALAALDRAAKRIIDGAGGAEAMGHVMKARDLLRAKIQGLKIKRRK